MSAVSKSIMSQLRMQIFTPTRRITLLRSVDFERVPRVGEWVSLDGVGGFLPRSVTDVVHDRNGRADVMLGANGGESDGVTLYSDEELAGSLAEFVEDGWAVERDLPNQRHAPLAELVVVVAALADADLEAREVPTFAEQYRRAWERGRSVLAPGSASDAERLAALLLTLESTGTCSQAERDEVRELAMTTAGGWRGVWP